MASGSAIDQDQYRSTEVEAQWSELFDGGWLSERDRLPSAVQSSLAPGSTSGKNESASSDDDTAKTGGGHSKSDVSLTFADFWATLHPTRRKMIDLKGAIWKDQVEAKMNHTLLHFNRIRGKALIEQIALAPEMYFLRSLELATCGKGLLQRKRRRSCVLETRKEDTHEENCEHYQCIMDKGSRVIPSRGKRAMSLERQLRPPQASSLSYEASEPTEQCNIPTPMPHTNSPKYEKPDPDLIRRIHNLPQELYDYLMATFMEHTVGERTALCDIASLHPRVLRSMGKQNYERMKDAFIKKTLWVLPPGIRSTDGYADGLRVVPPPFYGGIRKLYLRLGKDDACGICLRGLRDPFDQEFLRHVVRHQTFDWNRPPLSYERYEFDLCEVLGLYRACLDLLASELSSTWYRRCQWVAELHLDHLIFDVTDTYTPFDYRGLSLAEDLSRMMFRRTTGRTPKVIEVYAPTKELQQTIFDILTDTDRWSDEEW